MSILKNVHRIGNFTSSENSKLMTNGKEKGTLGKPALTYIKKKNNERRLGLSLGTESNAKPLVWGKLVEPRVFELLGLEYTYSSQETDVHPSIPYWSGSKDGMKHDDGLTVFDIKCPITRDSFCDLLEPLYQGLTGVAAMKYIRDNHDKGEDYYWQLVSNAVINDTKFAELIIYMPYESELGEIKMMADGVPNCYWVAMATEEELPFIKDGGYYKNLNVIRFEVPVEDKEALTQRVLLAGKMLIGNEPVMIAERDSEVSATIVSKPKVQLQKIA
jgi:hypothetical protein